MKKKRKCTSELFSRQLIIFSRESQTYLGYRQMVMLSVPDETRIVGETRTLLESLYCQHSRHHRKRTFRPRRFECSFQPQKRNSQSLCREKFISSQRQKETQFWLVFLENTLQLAVRSFPAHRNIFWKGSLSSVPFTCWQILFKLVQRRQLDAVSYVDAELFSPSSFGHHLASFFYQKQHQLLFSQLFFRFA